MVEPVVVPRSEHQLSRRLVDPDALKVLYRLKEAGYLAYLVGGSVRDLLVGRRPKDFDIGTSAHPYQVKRLFRNCWIIGRRFRLAHVKFGDKVIEVATFRRQVPAVDDADGGGPDSVAATTADASVADQHAIAGEGTGDLLIKRDNTFGTPEEDAFRRDFTVNALFYDIATFSIIDYVGGLGDLRAGVVRSIGDPEVRFREDPVRMLRAVALACRLGFTIDGQSEAAIRKCRRDIVRSAPARLLEEYYKILRAGSSEATFRRLVETGLLESVSPPLQRAASDALWRSLAELDWYRRRFDAVPLTLTNAILLGALLAPLGWSGDLRDEAGQQPSLGLLPIPRRERERLRQILAMQRRLATPHPSPRLVRGLTARAPFAEALTWFEIHGRNPDQLDRWRGWTRTGVESVVPDEGSKPRPRRRRRRSRRPPPVQ